MKKVIQAIGLSVISIGLLTGFIFYPTPEQAEEITPIVEVEQTVDVYTPPAPVEIVEPKPIEEELMSDEDIDLIALVTFAEAEGEPEEGKRLVIDTILNRIDHTRFPDTATGVIYQANQFTSMWNGRSDRSVVTDDIRELVIEELHSRTNSEVVFFRTGRYSDYGTPLFQVGHHYFSSY